MNQKRLTIDETRDFVTSVHGSGWSWTAISRAIGKDDKTVRRYASGLRRMTVGDAEALADAVARHKLEWLRPIGNMAIDTNTRVVGVGEYSRG